MQQNYMQQPYVIRTDVHHPRCQMGLGITQIIFGIGLFGFEVIYAIQGVVVWYSLADGIFFAVTGSIGIAAGKQRTRGLIIAVLIFCILTILSSGALVVIFIIGTLNYWNYIQIIESFNYYINLLVISHLFVNIIASSIVFIISVVQFFYTCSDLCNCCCNKRQRVIHNYAPQVYHNTTSNAIRYTEGAAEHSRLAIQQNHGASMQHPNPPIYNTEIPSQPYYYQYPPGGANAAGNDYFDQQKQQLPPYDNFNAINSQSAAGDTIGSNI